MKRLFALFLALATCSYAQQFPQQFHEPASTGGFADRIGIDTIAVARTTKFHTFDYSAAVRLGYELSPRFGLVLEAEGSDFHGTLIDSTLAAVKFSFPVSERFQPYLIGGAGYKPNWTEYMAGGGGINVNLGKSFRAFTEFMAEKTVDTTTSFRLSAGVGFRF